MGLKTTLELIDYNLRIDYIYEWCNWVDVTILLQVPDIMLNFPFQYQSDVWLNYLSKALGKPRAQEYHPYS